MCPTQFVRINSPSPEPNVSPASPLVIQAGGNCQQGETLAPCLLPAFILVSSAAAITTSSVRPSTLINMLGIQCAHKGNGEAMLDLATAVSLTALYYVIEIYLGCGRTAEGFSRKHFHAIGEAKMGMSDRMDVAFSHFAHDATFMSIDATAGRVRTLGLSIFRLATVRGFAHGKWKKQGRVAS